MGTLLHAICRNCGFTHNNIDFGSGMRERIPHVPAIQKNTGDFVVVALSDHPNLQFYHKPEMYKEPIKDFGIQHNDISLNPTGNFCPSCHEFTVDFIVFGEFD